LNDPAGDFFRWEREWIAMRLLRFLRRNDGLTTVEWVVLCGIVLIAALAISGTVMTGAGNLGTSVANKMDDAAN
jgi:Flp pilus assembly pilin Flp